DVQVYHRGRPLSRTIRTDARGEFKVPRAWPTNRDGYTLLISDGARIGWREFPRSPDAKPEDLSFRITLLPLDQAVQGELTDAQGKAVAGVTVTVRSLSHPANHGVYPYGLDREPVFPTARTDGR